MAGKVNNNINRRAHFTLIWKIMFAPRDRCYWSPDFTIQSMEMTTWNVEIMYDSTGRPALGYIRRKKDGGPKKIQIEFEIAYFDSNEYSLFRSSAYFHKNRCTREFEFPEMHEARSESCPKDSVAVRCRIWRKGTDISKSELCFARTQYDVYQRYYVWAVKHFSLVLQGEKRIRVLNGCMKECPQLILTLSLAEKNGQECVFLHLEAPHIRNTHFTVEAEISLLDAEGMVSFSKQEKTNISSYKKICKLSIFEKSELQCHQMLSDDVLLLRCELKLTPGIPIWSGIEDYMLTDYSVNPKMFLREESAIDFNEFNETAICPFKENVNKFKEDGTLSDVCLLVGTKSFPVHKFILSSRSPAFKAMFTSDVKENTSKCIDIPDLDADTLNRLLLYIYKDEVQELTWEIAANLFKAADKYELMALKEKCSCFLKLNLSKCNVCEILILADMYHDESLFNSVQEFILNNSEIICSDVWKVFKQNHSKLALETTEQIICNMKHSVSVH